jgi:hypothetical protein
MNPMIVESTHKTDTHRGSFPAIQEPTANKLIPNVNIDAPVGYKLIPTIDPVRIIAIPTIQQS